MALKRALIGSTEGQQVNLQVPQFLHHGSVGAVVDRPAVDEHAVDPPLEQAWQRPPVNGEHQYQGVGAVDAGLLGDAVSRRFGAGAMYALVGSVVARVEAFGGKGGDFER